MQEDNNPQQRLINEGESSRFAPNVSPAVVDNIPSITVTDTFKIIFNNAGVMILARVITRSSDFAINAIMANTDSSAEGQQDIVAATALIGTLQRLTQAIAATWLSIYGNQIGEIQRITSITSANDEMERSLSIGRLYKQSLFVSGCFFWIPFAVLLLNSGRLLKLIGEPSMPSNIAQDYFNKFVFSLIPTFFNNTVQIFSLSVKKPWHAFSSNLIFTLAYLGFTAYFVLKKNDGYAGTGTAATCAEAIAFVGLFIVHQIKYFKCQDYRLYKSPYNFLPTPAETKRFFKEGGKHALQMGSDLATNWIMTIIIGHNNTVNLDASQIGFQYYYLLLIPLANAVTAISYSVSEQKKPVDARRLADITLILSFIAPLVLVITSIIFPREFISPFLGKNEQSEVVMDTAKSLLWLANATLCLYLPRITGGAYIRGLTGGTSKALKASTFSNIVTLVGGTLLWMYTSLNAKSFFLARLIGEAIVTPWLMREGRKIHYARQAPFRMRLLSNDMPPSLPEQPTNSANMMTPGGTRAGAQQPLRI